MPCARHTVVRGYRVAHHRQIDLVVTTVQYLVGIGQGRLARHTSYGLAPLRPRLPLRRPIRLALSSLFGF